MIDSLPLLTLCWLVPALGALVVLLAANRPNAKIIALGATIVELLLCLLIWQRFDPSQSGFQLVEDHAWIPGLNIRYQLGVDGISVGFLPMTALISLMALLANWQCLQRLNRLQLALLLLLESITIGVFCAVDLALFFLFWELTLPPLFFLIGLWGIGAHRRYAAMKYTLYMLFGGVPILFAIVMLALAHGAQHGGELSFSLPVLLNTPLAEASQNWVFGLLLLGFAVKAPLVPLHNWLPTTAMEASPAITALLLSLKLGVYGILRFAIPLAPSAAQHHRWLLALLGAITLVYAAMIALRQSNLRRMLAYAGISHVGMVVVAISVFNLQGLQGALLQLLNFTVIAGSLMLLVGMVQQRLGSSELVHWGGLAKTMPRWTTLFFLFALASIGVPGSNGFVAEFLMLLGVLQVYPALALLALFAAVLAAAYMLNFVRHGLFGPIKQPAVAKLVDLRPRELALLIVPALLVLLLGLMPQWLLSAQEATLKTWLLRVHSPATLITDARPAARIAASDPP